MKVNRRQLLGRPAHRRPVQAAGDDSRTLPMEVKLRDAIYARDHGADDPTYGRVDQLRIRALEAADLRCSLTEKGIKHSKKFESQLYTSSPDVLMIFVFANAVLIFFV